MILRTPPEGSITSPFLLGIKWIWQCEIVWPASAPSFTPILNPEIVLSNSHNVFFEVLISIIQSMYSSGVKSK